MRIGAVVPTFGSTPAQIGIPAMAQRLEAAGFESLWCTDRVVAARSVESAYPFSADRRPAWDPSTAFYDTIVAMSMIAAVTRRVSVGSAVLVLPLRHPVILAKQIASLDALSGGRVRLGVGVGWMQEEYEALGIDFDDRGRRFDEALHLLRACWTGEPEEFAGSHFNLPPGVLCYPRPLRPPQVLLGGNTKTARRRAIRQADGWLGLRSVDDLDAAELAPIIEQIREGAAELRRDAAPVEIVLRVIKSAGKSEQLAPLMRPLGEIGVDEIIIDIDWLSETDAAQTYSRLSTSAE